jgi:hypothetical protein
MNDLARLRRLRGQLAAEHAKAVRADQQPRPDLDHLRVTAPNGIAAGLEVAIFFADHHLREAGEAARTTPDNPVASSNAVDNCCVCGGSPVVYRNFLERPFCRACADCQCGENPCVRTGINDPAVSRDARLRQESEAWRRKAVRRALAVSKLQGTIQAVTDLASEEITARTEWGDGYRAAIADLQEVLREFGCIEPAVRSDGPREQQARPTHPDGTPYRYHEIVAEGWEYCDGCHMWTTATQEQPHRCARTHIHGPFAAEAGEQP